MRHFKKFFAARKKYFKLIKILVLQKFRFQKKRESKVSLALWDLQVLSVFFGNKFWIYF